MSGKSSPTKLRRCIQNKLRSEVDVSFADANLAQAQLLLLDAQNNYQAALSMLSQVLGYPSQQQFDLVDTESRAEAASGCRQPTGRSSLQQSAGNCAAELRVSGRSAFPEGRAGPAIAQRRGFGRGGRTFRIAAQSERRSAPFIAIGMAAIGVNVNIPIFNGFLYPARSQRSGTAGAGRRSATARSERPDCQRRADTVG